MYISRYVKYPFIFLDFKEVEFFRQIFKKILIYKISSIGSPVVTCGRMDGRTGVAKIIAALRKFTKAHKIIKQRGFGKTID
jgi:hypothetical protein